MSDLGSDRRRRGERNRSEKNAARRGAPRPWMRRGLVTDGTSTTGQAMAEVEPKTVRPNECCGLSAQPTGGDGEGGG